MKKDQHYWKNRPRKQRHPMAARNGERELLQELARRAVSASENAQLYRESQELNAELEKRVAERTEELQASVRMLWDEIEERKKVEAALRQSETVLNSLFESAPDATLLVDKAGRIVQVNRLVEVVFGYERDELIGRPVETLIPAHYHHRHSGHRDIYFKKMETRPMGVGLELYAVRKDGGEFPVDVMLSPVNMEAGELVISVVRDITLQKRMQTELTETHQRLFESVEAERLRLAQELHDGPMQELYGLTYMVEDLRPTLTESGSAEEGDNPRDTIQNVINTLRAICGELRPPTLAHFGFEKAVQAHLVGVREKNPDITFQVNMVKLERPLPERVQVALFRVYQNTISNILRHAGATRVRISSQVKDEEIVFRVEDNGSGFVMPARLVELARAGHFGLVGMTERVEALGGRLQVVSTPGRGTTVQVVVPMD